MERDRIPGEKEGEPSTTCTRHFIPQDESAWNEIGDHANNIGRAEGGPGDQRDEFAAGGLFLSSN